MNRLPLLLLLPSLVVSSFCGQQAVPFTFQALKSGQPVLGCARPRCFSAGVRNGTGEPAQFYRIHGKEDGYMRKSEGVKGGRNEMAACSMSFSSSSCGIGQWVGGIAPQADVKTRSQLRCCAYGPLLQSEDRGIATVKPGQLVVGGEVLVDGKVVAFDYVADLAKTVKDDGTVEYNVALRRMSCFDEPIAASNEIIGEPSDISLQRIEQQPSNPVPYSPWANVPPPVQQPAAAAAPVESATEYPGQPRDLQPEILESAAAPRPHPRQYAVQQFAPASAAEKLQQEQQTVAAAFNSPAMNPMMAQLQQQQAELAKQQQQLILAQQQLLAAQQLQQQQQAASAAQAVQPQLQQLQQARQVQPQPAAATALTPAQQLAAFYAANPALAGPSAMRPALPLSAMGRPDAQQQMQMALPRLPKLEELPKLNIPSIEQVENAIPPLEKAVLTTVARFFGVL